LQRRLARPNQRARQEIATKGWSITRALGMILTFLPMLGFAAWDIARALG
jgi:hypothetical protein